MANDHHHEGSAMDYAEHEKTYAFFGSLIKWGTVFSLVFTMLVGSFTGTLPWLLTIVLGAAMAFIAAKFV